MNPIDPYVERMLAICTACTEENARDSVIAIYALVREVEALDQAQTAEGNGMGTALREFTQAAINSRKVGDACRLMHKHLPLRNNQPKGE